MTNINKLEKILKRVEKPGRYIGGEKHQIVKKEADLRMGFAFPDLYEIGMSYMGLQILYNILNNEEGIACERVFSPGTDMENELIKENLPLFTLESKIPINELDILGFTLQYEMSFTNILNILKLGKIPLRSVDRNTSHPLVIAGGPCAYNPEPIAPFIDIFLIGDGEIALPKLVNLYKENIIENGSRRDFLKRIAAEDLGAYIPAFYTENRDESNIITGYTKSVSQAPEVIKRSIIDDLNKIDFPIKPIVPLIEAVHDRSVVETFRGCTRGCRFCQAGIIYRPVRERSKEEILSIAKAQLKNTGNDELSILSLSTSDYSCFEDLAIELMEYCKDNDVSLSLPSLRLDSFSFKVLNEIQGYKKSGLTFAPEAGTQRLRDVINKGIEDRDIYEAVEQAIELGWRNIKLYFMIGLPTETEKDLDGIAEIASNIVKLHKSSGKGGRFNVTVSVSNFVPKPHTPFQWIPQNSPEEFRSKHQYLSQKLRMPGVRFNYHDDEVSKMEAVVARGDRKIADLIEAAHKKGCRFDGWSEHFSLEKWLDAANDLGIDLDFYTTRQRSEDEVFPWDKIDTGVSKTFLLREYYNAKNGLTTPDCRYGCVGCGMNRNVECKWGGIYDK